MAIRLHFWGADQTVTGSSHHLECAGHNILLDCGLYQGKRTEAADINAHLAFTPDQLAGKTPPQLNSVVLSHAHIDHSGDLPLLAKQGYRGPIYATPATIDLCNPMLKDSAHIQEGDADFLARRRGRRAAMLDRPSFPPYPARRPNTASACNVRTRSPDLRQCPRKRRNSARRNRTAPHPRAPSQRCRSPRRGAVVQNPVLGRGRPFRNPVRAGSCRPSRPCADGAILFAA